MVLRSEMLVPWELMGMGLRNAFGTLHGTSVMLPWDSHRTRGSLREFHGSNGHAWCLHGAYVGRMNHWDFHGNNDVMQISWGLHKRHCTPPEPGRRPALLKCCQNEGMNYSPPSVRDSNNVKQRAITTIPRKIGTGRNETENVL